MKIFLLSLISILFSTTYSQQCSNTHNQAVVISVSLNGHDIENIGTSTYLSTINDAIDQFLPTSSATRLVASYGFGGITSSTSLDEQTIWELLAIGNNDYSTINTSIWSLADEDNLDNFLYENSWANVVGDAVSNAESVLSSLDGYQKYHVIFAAGNPLSNGFGDTTGPLNPDNPCPQSRASKRAGMMTICLQ